MRLGNEWLVQHKAHLDFQSIYYMLYKDCVLMTMFVNTMQSQSQDPHRFIVMQFKRPVRKGATIFLVQLIMVGDDVENTLALPYLIPQCWRHLLLCLSLHQVEQEIAQSKALEPDGNPPFRPIYRLGPLEL